MKRMRMIDLLDCSMTCSIVICLYCPMIGMRYCRRYAIFCLQSLGSVAGHSRAPTY
jgi:hypothetical protein